MRNSLGWCYEQITLVRRNAVDNMTQYQEVQQRIQKALLSLSQRAEAIGTPQESAEHHSQSAAEVHGALAELKGKLDIAEAFYAALHERIATVEAQLADADLDADAIHAQYQARLDALQARFDLFHSEASAIAAALDAALGDPMPNDNHD